MCCLEKSLVHAHNPLRAIQPGLIELITLEKSKYSVRILHSNQNSFLKRGIPRKLVKCSSTFWRERFVVFGSGNAAAEHHVSSSFGNCYQPSWHAPPQAWVAVYLSLKLPQELRPWNTILTKRYPFNASCSGSMIDRWIFSQDPIMSMRLLTGLILSWMP